MANCVAFLHLVTHWYFSVFNKRTMIIVIIERRWRSQYNAGLRNYNSYFIRKKVYWQSRHQYTTDPAAALWPEITTIKIDSLEPGRVYSLRIVAIGTNDRVSFSDVVTRMVAWDCLNFLSASNKARVRGFCCFSEVCSLKMDSTAALAAFPWLNIENCSFAIGHSLSNWTKMFNLQGCGSILIYAKL